MEHTIPRAVSATDAEDHHHTLLRGAHGQIIALIPAFNEERFIGSLVLQARARTETGDANGGPPRFGFTATRRIGTAVARNRARRRLKESIRRVAESHARPGYDYVVIARQGALTRSFANMQKDLQDAFCGVHKKQEARN